MADEREVLVEVKNLEVTYGSGRKAYKAVKNANFTIYKGETFGLVGESGSGKTTIGPAMVSAAPPRRSFAYTTAPESFSTPLTIAVLSFWVIFAPIFISSAQWRKRFSKRFSTITLVPSATVHRANICACISVGKPG